ncbi:MAG: hypothetical protein QOJ98_2330 [Acidobacteriota bacterium]|jgi:hypothetical protein|nr:hypothetical protein [Acidobacteriota bacterium]
MDNDEFRHSGQTRSGIPLSPAGERTLRIDDVPARDEEKKGIHQRRPLPLIPGCEDDGNNAPADSTRDSD